MIESVKIIYIYIWNEIKEYRFWADFLRFIGVQVCGCTLRTATFLEDFNLVMVVNKSMSEENLERIKNNYPKLVIIDPIESDEQFDIESEIKNKGTVWKQTWIQYMSKGMEQIRDFPKPWLRCRLEPFLYFLNTF